MAFWDKRKENKEKTKDSSSKYIYRASEELALQDEAEKKAAEKENAKKDGKSKDGKSKKRQAKKVRRSFTIWQILPFLFVLLLFAVITIKIVSYVGGISRTPLQGDEYIHAERFSNGIRVEGIDVSEHQGKIKWKKVKSSGADFAFIRAAFRRSETGELVEDATFKDNIKAANKAGIMVGAYIYSQAISTKEAEEEADFLVDLVKRYEIDLPLVIDYEIYPGGRLEQAITSEKLFAASHFNDITTAFCRKVEKEGYESAIYANTDMFTNYMDASLIDKENTLWVAHYGGECGLESDYLFWQASDSAVCGGIEGSVDHDFWYIEPGKVYPTRAKGKKKQTSIADCTINFDKSSYEIKNHRAIPEVTVTNKDGKTLKEGKDYEVSFIRNIKPGSGFAIVRGIRKYKDWTSIAFTIE
jgi:GH25 family lysozyme M1 (1,4-beta-N-acetylmuramidase)